MKSNGDVENRYGITTKSQQYAAGYDEGFSCRYRVGVCDGWSRGFDEGLKEAERQHG
jgi:hypothetical protein